MRVAPFGHLRISGYVLLPAAFRSLSRPSSAPSAKASALCSFSLDHFYRCTSVYTCSISSLLPSRPDILVFRFVIPFGVTPLMSFLSFVCAFYLPLPFRL